MNQVDYESATTPPNYKCADCKAFGVKLWRQYHGDLLRCATCALKQAGETGPVNEEGLRLSH